MSLHPQKKRPPGGIYQQIFSHLQAPEAFVFSVDEFYTFLRFPSPERCERAILLHPNPKFRQQLNGHKVPHLWLSKESFLAFALHQRPEDQQLLSLFGYYQGKRLRDRVLKFEDKGETPVTPLDLHKSVTGRFYTYSLDTWQLSADLGLDPQQVFDLVNGEGLCSAAQRIDFKRLPVWMEAEIEYGIRFVPFASFNSLAHHHRAEVLPVLECLWEKGNLSTVQKGVLEVLAEAIQELLTQQQQIDELRQRLAEEARQLSLRNHYKTAAQLCHPDRYLQEADRKVAHRLFLELTSAYEADDLKGVRETHLRVVETLGEKTDETKYRELAG